MSVLKDDNQKVIENNETAIKIKNKVVAKSAVELYRDIKSFDDKPKIAENITKQIKILLQNEVFFSEEINLSDKQLDALKRVIEDAIYKGYSDSCKNISKDEYSSHISNKIREHTANTINEFCNGIGKELNRGAVIHGTAIAADATNKDYNFIKIRTLKESGTDISIPADTITIATNSVKTIMHAVENIKEESKRLEKEAENEK